MSRSDSDAVLDPSRVLPQHQAALTLLQARLSNPAATSLAWLDLACGRGQIIATLDHTLSEKARAKIDFTGIDINDAFLRETARIADRLRFRSVETHLCALSLFDRVLPPETKYDFITLTNTVHEIEPPALAALLVDSVTRLSEKGSLYIYDMETINPPELGRRTLAPW